MIIKRYFAAPFPGATLRELAPGAARRDGSRLRARKALGPRLNSKGLWARRSVIDALV